jgi:Tol biopolymer transport system component
MVSRNKIKGFMVLAILILICDGFLSHAQKPQRLVFSTTLGEDTPGGLSNRLYVMDENGEGKKLLLSHAECDKVRYCKTPYLYPSPNRQYVAFQETRLPDPDLVGLYVVGGAFTIPKKVAEDTLFPNQVSWSPNNKQFAYVAIEPERHVYIYTLETGVSERLHPGNEQTADPAWSPDGKYITYNSNSQPETLYIMNVSDKTSRITIPNGTFAAWSPDGKQFAFWDTPGYSDLDEGRPYLKVMKVDDATQRVVVGFLTRNVDWSPDGTQLAYHALKADDKKICMLTIDTGQEKCLTLETYAFQLGPIWSPDGENLVFSAIGYTKPIYSIFIINADGSDLKQIGDTPKPAFLMWW